MMDRRVRDAVVISVLLHVTQTQTRYGFHKFMYSSNFFFFRQQKNLLIFLIYLTRLKFFCRFAERFSSNKMIFFYVYGHCDFVYCCFFIDNSEDEATSIGKTKRNSPHFRHSDITVLETGKGELADNAIKNFPLI